MLQWCQGRWRGADVTKEFLETHFHLSCTLLRKLCVHYANGFDSVDSVYFFYSNPVCVCVCMCIYISLCVKGFEREGQHSSVRGPLWLMWVPVKIMIWQPEGKAFGSEWQKRRLTHKVYPDALAFKDGTFYSHLFRRIDFVREQFDWWTFPDEWREAMDGVKRWMELKWRFKGKRAPLTVRI
jgi:hypothetical protein